nr:zinc finger, CCHC-type [Tanacetum cinerariifolium]
MTQRRNTQLTKENQSGINEQSNLILEDDESSLLMTIHKTEYEEVLLNEGQIQPGKYATADASIWYLDNGESNHMTRTKSHFKDIDENVTGRVRFGDESYVQIKGRGSILLGYKNNEQKIVLDIYYIPNLKSNILSLGQLTEIGCKIIMDGNKLTLYDKNKKLLIKVERSKNRLYSIRLQIEAHIWLLVNVDNQAWLWHARVGHLNFDDINKMTRKENGIARQLTAPYSPQQNGVVERRNRTVLSTTRSMMKVMKLPLTFRAKAVKHAIYILNRMTAYAKVIIPHLKKLDDESIPMIYLGVEEGSKACRLYDPKGKRKHVSRDIRFMETKSWDWDNNGKETSTQDTFWASFVVEGVDNENPTPVNTENNDNTYQEQEPITDPDSPITPPVYTYNLNSEEEEEATISSLMNSENQFDDTPEQGIDFDEVFTPVARIETVRLILALAAYHGWQVHHLDVKSAFLHGDLKEEVYVTQPEGFIQQGNLGKVYKITKALYGLRQAPRAWNMKLDQTLKSLDFKKCNLEQAVYTKRSKSSTLIVGVYIPMDPGTKLVKAEDENSVDATYYRNLIGSLMYLLHTRPDLSYSVRLLSRFMQDPKDYHLKAVKQVIRYIKRTKEHGIIYKKEGGCKITGYNDSSYGINTEQEKGTTGIVFYFGESPITWCTHKQPTVALSSCESEFMTATGAACQALWLKRLLSEITGWEEERITLKVDNISAIALVRNLVFHGRSKHIDIRCHFIRECVENGHINMEHISGELQRADILTKALPRLKFVTMRQMLRVQDLGRSNDRD